MCTRYVARLLILLFLAIRCIDCVPGDQVHCTAGKLGLPVGLGHVVFPASIREPVSADGTA